MHITLHSGTKTLEYQILLPIDNNCRIDANMLSTFSLPDSILRDIGPPLIGESITNFGKYEMLEI